MPSGNKPISGFGDGVPVAGDYFVFESAGGVTLRIDFGVLQGLLAVAGASGRDAPFLLAEDPIEPDEPMMIPGQRGLQGLQGNPGAINNNNIITYLMAMDGEDGENAAPPIPGQRGVAGIDGTIGRDGKTIFMLPESPLDPDEPMLVPGPRGATGSGGTGPIGPAGSPVIMLPDDPDPPEEPLMIPGQRGATGAEGPPGGGGAGSDPFEGSYDPGSFDIADGDYVIMGKQLIISGVNQVQLLGNSRLVIL